MIGFGLPAILRVIVGLIVSSEIRSSPLLVSILLQIPGQGVRAWSRSVRIVPSGLCVRRSLRSSFLVSSMLTVLFSSSL